MIKKLLNYKKYAMLLVLGVASTQLYQNCGQLATFEADSAGNLDLGSALSHPSVVELTPPMQKTVTINRKATESLLRDIFTSTTSPVPDLETLIQQWVGKRAPQYGGACNPYDSYAANDCGDIGNANLAINQDASTLRESFHTQFCENVLAYDQGVNAVLEKITRQAATPDANSIGQIYELFYRGETTDPLILNSLLDLDRSLAVKSEATLDRWRAVILQVCNSTGWEIL